MGESLLFMTKKWYTIYVITLLVLSEGQLTFKRICLGEDPVKKAGSSVSLVSRDIKLLSGVWQQVKCENVWRYNLAIGKRGCRP